MLRDSTDIATFIESNTEMMRLLGAVADLRLPDGWKFTFSVCQYILLRRQ